MNWWLIGAGVIVYAVVATVLDRTGRLPAWVEVWGPVATLHTDRGIDLLERAAAPERAWRLWGRVSEVLVLGGIGAMFAAVVIAAYSAVGDPSSAGISEPANVLVVPGVNDYLPLAAAPEILAGVLVGIGVHELGHGVLCRVEDIEVDTVGVLLLALVPAGAFVDPDEDSLLGAAPTATGRMLAVGAANNLVVTGLALALLAGPVTGSIAPAPGAPVGSVLDGGPADEAGIAAGDRITALGNRSVDDADDLIAALNATGPKVSAEVDGERRVTIERAVTVLSDRGPAGLQRGDVVTAVNGTDVATVREFHAELAARPVARLATADGETVSTPVGAVVEPTPEGALAQAGAPTGTQLVITRAAGERTPDGAALVDALREHDPGDEVRVVAYANGTRQTYDVTLDGDAGEGVLGVAVQSEPAGLAVTDVGVEPYPAEGYLGLLAGEGGDGVYTPSSVATWVLTLILLPLASVTGLAPFNFAGFTPRVANFYVVEGPLAPLGGAVFTLANVCFWTAWLNVQLGAFNCIPAYPLDGARVLQSRLRAGVGGLRVGDRPARLATYAVTGVMAACLVGMLVAITVT